MRRTVIHQMLNYDGHDVHQHVLQDFGSVSICFRRYISAGVDPGFQVCGVGGALK